MNTDFNDYQSIGSESECGAGGDNIGDWATSSAPGCPSEVKRLRQSHIPYFSFDNDEVIQSNWHPTEPLDLGHECVFSPPENQLGKKIQEKYLRAKYKAVTDTKKRVVVPDSLNRDYRDYDYILLPYTPKGKDGKYVLEGLFSTETYNQQVKKICEEDKCSLKEARKILLESRRAIGPDQIDVWSSWCVEIDCIPLDKQLERLKLLYKKTGIMVSAITYSGNKSYHAHIFSNTPIKDRDQHKHINTMLSLFLQSDPSIIDDWSQSMRLGGHSSERKQPLIHLNPTYYHPDDIQNRLEWAMSEIFVIKNDKDLREALRKWKIISRGFSCLKKANEYGLGPSQIETIKDCIRCHLNTPLEEINKLKRIIHEANPKAASAIDGNEYKVIYDPLTEYNGSKSGSRTIAPCCAGRDKHDTNAKIYIKDGVTSIWCFTCKVRWSSFKYETQETNGVFTSVENALRESKTTNETPIKARTFVDVPNIKPDYFGLTKDVAKAWMTKPGNLPKFATSPGWAMLPAWKQAQIIARKREVARYRCNKDQVDRVERVKEKAKEIAKILKAAWGKNYVGECRNKFNSVLGTLTNVGIEQKDGFRDCWGSTCPHCILHRVSHQLATVMYFSRFADGAIFVSEMTPSNITNLFKRTELEARRLMSSSITMMHPSSFLNKGKDEGCINDIRKAIWYIKHDDEGRASVFSNFATLNSRQISVDEALKIAVDHASRIKFVISKNNDKKILKTWSLSSTHNLPRDIRKVMSLEQTNTVFTLGKPTDVDKRKIFEMIKQMGVSTKLNLLSHSGDADEAARQSEDEYKYIEEHGIPSPNVRSIKYVGDYVGNKQKVIDLSRLLCEDNIFDRVVGVKNQFHCINMTPKIRKRKVTFDSVATQADDHVNYDNQISVIEQFVTELSTDDYIEPPTEHPAEKIIHQLFQSWSAHTSGVTHV